jgi:hypothetical protein
MGNSIIEAQREFERWKSPMIHNMQFTTAEELETKTQEIIEKLEKHRNDRSLYLSTQSRSA